MENLLTFFLEVSKLKTVKRTGWVLRGVENPETIAEHSWRTAILAWVLGAQSKGLDVNRMIQTALVHDICEVYAGDVVPHYGVLPEDPVEKREMLKRWLRVPQDQKASFSKKKYEMEKESMEKLLAFLSPSVRDDVYSMWQKFENGIREEERFVLQIDKIEAMLQAIEYFGTEEGNDVTGWWEQVEELVVNPLLASFVEAIQHRYYDKQETPFDGAFAFLETSSKLKRRPQKTWEMRNVQEPDSVANHLFFLSLMVLVVAKEKQLSLDREKALKMALISRINWAEQEQRSMYDEILKEKMYVKEREQILKKWVRYSVDQKRAYFDESMKEGKESLAKILQPLPQELRDEMASLWLEYWTGGSEEAEFVKQMVVLEILLQALQYWEEDRNFGIEAFWEWAYEYCSKDLSKDFLKLFEEEFYQKKKEADASL